MSELQTMVLSLIEAGHTQANIAKAVGIAQSSISKIKTGKKKEVLASKAKRLHAFHHKTFFSDQQTKNPVSDDGASCADQ